MQSSIFAFDSVHVIDCAPAADTSVNTFECKQPPEGEKETWDSAPEVPAHQQEQTQIDFSN